MVSFKDARKFVQRVLGYDDYAAFRPEAKAAWFNQYKASTDFNGQLKCTQSVDDYEKNRIKNIEGFNAIKAPDGKSLTEKLRDLGLEAEVNNALKSDALEREINLLKEDLVNLSKRISEANPPLDFSPAEISAYLLSRKGELETAVNNYLNEVKPKLNNLSNSPDYQSIKDEIVTTLEKNKEEFTKLEKAINDDANALFQASQKEFERIAYLSRKYHESPAMREAITNLISANAEGMAVAYNIDGGHIFKGVDPNKLTVFETGKSWVPLITRQFTKSGDSFSTQTHTFQTDAEIQQDAAELVKILKSCGYDAATVRFRNKDPKEAERIAELYFEAMTEAGMDPKKITIEVNGVPKLKYDDKGELALDKEAQKERLLKDKPQLLDYGQKQAAEASKKTKELVEGDSKAAAAKMKGAMEAMRSQAPRQEQSDEPGNRPVNL